MCERNDLNLVFDDAVDDGVRESVEQEVPTQIAVEEREALRGHARLGTVEPRQPRSGGRRAARAPRAAPSDGRAAE
jgi:hypothetical protein